MMQQRFLRGPFSPLAVLAAFGLILGGMLLATMAGRAAPQIPTGSGQLVQPDPNAIGPAAAAQPMVVQALDATHFVVVTREPRLVSKVGEEGRYMNMILPVVTHYTVQNGHLIPIEHVHVPQGYRALGAGE
jgi:hypothetical protein